MFAAPPSTHVDEDGNEIASFDDGDNNVYEHANGTTKSDISAHNYYGSANTGTNVTDGGGTQIAGTEMSVTSTKSGILVGEDGSYTIPEGESPFTMEEVTYVGAAVATIGHLKIKGGKNVPEELQGSISNGGGSVGATMGAGRGINFEILAVTKGKIVLNESVTGRNLEEMFSNVNFISTYSFSAALKHTSVTGYTNERHQNKIFHAKLYGAGVSTVGVSGSKSAVEFK